MNSVESIGSNIEEFQALEFLVREVIQRKQAANEVFSQGNYALAASHYQQSLALIHDLRSQFSHREDILQTSNVLFILREAHMNLALCHIK